jgi:hypothetical protein
MVRTILFYNIKFVYNCTVYFNKNKILIHLGNTVCKFNSLVNVIGKFMSNYEI